MPDIFRIPLSRIDTATNPDISFSADGRKMIIAFEFDQSPIPVNEPMNPNHPLKNSHRDIIKVNGTYYGQDKKVNLSLTSGTAVLTVRLSMNSKVPGTGAARLEGTNKE